MAEMKDDREYYKGIACYAQDILEDVRWEYTNLGEIRERTLTILKRHLDMHDVRTTKRRGF